MRVFISHSSTNANIAQQVCGLLEANNHTCFLAPRDIRTGYEYAEELVNGIDSSNAMLLLLSEAANNSPHVLREIERAVSKKIPIVVYKLEEVQLSKSMEYFLMTHQWVNAKPGEGHQVIVDCINQFAAKGQAAYVAENASYSGTVSTSVSSIGVTSASQSNRKSKMPVVIGAAVAVVLVIGIVIGAFALGKGSGDGDNGKFENANNLENSISTEAGQEQTSQNSDVQNQNSTQSAGDTHNSNASVKLGDTITLGKYNNEAIDWRVIKISEDGKQAVVVANNILTMKAFDVAESGKYNSYEGKDYWSVPTSEINSYSEDLQHKLRGNNQWSVSNIRTWLNSTRENVTYSDQAPSMKATSNMQNGYDTEAGFLKGFTSDELAAVVTTQVKTGDVITEDKVFLLSEEELQWLADADVSKYAVPTDAAVTQDQTKIYKGYSLDFNVKDFYWWLRSAGSSVGEVAAYEGCIVGNSYVGGKLVKTIVGVESYGIRPAMTIDLASNSVSVKK